MMPWLGSVPGGIGLVLTAGLNVWPREETIAKEGQTCPAVTDHETKTAAGRY